jgi:hypothetical protein
MPASVSGHAKSRCPLTASPKRMAEELCGKWMPRKKTTCARGAGHGGPHAWRPRPWSVTGSTTAPAR